jgi:hypothetical protein
MYVVTHSPIMVANSGLLLGLAGGFFWLWRLRFEFLARTQQLN